MNWEDATIHVMSHVVHYGSSVFEGIRCYATPDGPAIFRLQRAHAAARRFVQDLPHAAHALACETLMQGCIDTVAENELRALLPAAGRSCAPASRWASTRWMPARDVHHSVDVGRVPRAGGARERRRRLRFELAPRRAGHASRRWPRRAATT